SKEIGELKRQKQDASHVLLKVEAIKSDIPALELKLGKIDEKINKELIVLPNIPADDVPVGKDESANIEIKKWGTIRHFDFEVKDHTQLGEALNILDFERATKITGPRF